MNFFTKLWRKVCPVVVPLATQTAESVAVNAIERNKNHLGAAGEIVAPILESEIAPAAAAPTAPTVSVAAASASTTSTSQQIETAVKAVAVTEAEQAAVAAIERNKSSLGPAAGIIAPVLEVEVAQKAAQITPQN